MRYLCDMPDSPQRGPGRTQELSWRHAPQVLRLCLIHQPAGGGAYVETARRHDSIGARHVHVILCARPASRESRKRSVLWQQPCCACVRAYTHPVHVIGVAAVAGRRIEVRCVALRVSQALASLLLVGETAWQARARLLNSHLRRLRRVYSPRLRPRQAAAMICRLRGLQQSTVHALQASV